MRHEISTLKQNLSFFRGSIKKSEQVLNEDGYCCITTSIDNRVVSGDSIPQMPTLYPYGLISVPTAKSNSVGGFLTGTFQNPFIAGVFPAFTESDFRLANLTEGESALYSNKYSVRVENGGCFFSAQDGENYVTPAVIGQWMKKIQIDIIEQLKEIIDDFMSQMKVTFDAHVHTSALPGSDTSIPNNGSFPSFNIDPALLVDLQALEDEEIFVTPSGKLP